MNSQLGETRAKVELWVGFETINLIFDLKLLMYQIFKLLGLK